MFLRYCDEILFCDVIKGEFLYLRRHGFRNSPKTLTLHSTKSPQNPKVASIVLLEKGK